MIHQTIKMENQATKSGTIGGTLLTVVFSIQPEDLAKTAILAAVGAAVSFGVSIALKLLVKKIFRKSGNIPDSTK